MCRSCVSSTCISRLTSPNCRRRDSCITHIAGRALSGARRTGLLPLCLAVLRCFPGAILLKQSFFVGPGWWRFAALLILHQELLELDAGLPRRFGLIEPSLSRGKTLPPPQRRRQ